MLKSSNWDMHMTFLAAQLLVNHYVFAINDAIIVTYSGGNTSVADIMANCISIFILCLMFVSFIKIQHIETVYTKMCISERALQKCNQIHHLSNID